MEDLTLLQEMIDMHRNKIKETRLRSFVEESNRIEGISDVRQLDLSFDRTKELLATQFLTCENLYKFNTYGKIRRLPGMDVRVGNHVPPLGGTAIYKTLNVLLQKVNDGACPYLIHQEFETLHPFTDGNGRTGRALWLWQMVNQQDYNVSQGFLHRYYYQSLENSETRG